MRIANHSLFLKPTVCTCCILQVRELKERRGGGAIPGTQGLVFCGRMLAAHILQTSI